MDSSLDMPADLAPPPASQLWWIVPAAAFLLLIVVAMIIGPPPEPGGKRSSYDASDDGYRAAFLILEELKYPVERSRLAAGGAVRWVLSPTDVREQNVANLDNWIRRGGVVLLATDNKEFASQFGLTLRKAPADDTVPTTGRDIHSLDGGLERVELVGATGTPWEGVRERPQAGGAKPLALVTIIRHGNGAIWFLHRPAVLRNGPMRRADNAVFLSRLADAMLEDRSGQIVFDEYCHGLRERPTVAALLLRPPMLAITIQALILTGLVLWAVAPRFGPIRSDPPPNRRSKEEFLDAVADLLRRKGDFGDAYRTVQQDLRRRIESALGWPADLPADQLAHEAERRRGTSADSIRDLLDADEPPGGPGSAAFVTALQQLVKLRHEFSDRRPAGR
jgi:hypothetical protein